MQDKWMNIGHDNEPLQPFTESRFNDCDESRLSTFWIYYLLLQTRIAFCLVELVFLCENNFYI